MRKYGTTFALAAVAGLLMASALPSDAVARKHAARARSGAFDGLWSVLIQTKAGPCDATYRYPARIVRGVVVQAENDFSYVISGAVTGSGAIEVTVSQGIQSATGHGRLRGSKGGGNWSAGGNTCSGTWSAMRRSPAN
jgi:hypothetical protein